VFNLATKVTAGRTITSKVTRGKHGVQNSQTAISHSCRC